MRQVAERERASWIVGRELQISRYNSRWKERSETGFIAGDAITVLGRGGGVCGWLCVCDIGFQGFVWRSNLLRARLKPNYLPRESNGKGTKCGGLNVGVVRRVRL